MMRRIVFSLWIWTITGALAVAWAAEGAATPYPCFSPPGSGTTSGNAVQTVNDKQFQKLFHQGYDHYNAGEYQEAVNLLFTFLSQRTPDETDYEWAEFFFGISLFKLGFSHAAVDTLTHLVIRKPNPKIVNYSLELLEQISRSKPFDRGLLLDLALCDQSYDFVQGQLADFVHYYQGEYDWEHGLFDWGDDHFSKIRPNTYYFDKYLFKRALRAIYAEQSQEAVDLLKQVIAHCPDGEPLKDDARKTLARLYYEKGKFSDADFMYQQIEMNIVEQAENLLERAWAHYRMGNSQRAMGLLYSFEAPSFADSFTPEFYILKSFIYKDVCHYQAVMSVLEQFKERYGESIEKIYQRAPPQENQAMLHVLLNKPKIKRYWRFLDLLERESKACEGYPDVSVKSYLDELYHLKRKQAENAFRLLIRDEYEKMADAMLGFEEEAHLIEYEIGIDMYQRVQDYHYSETSSEEADTKKPADGKAVYAFQGEFWNDELDDYEVELPNKCQNAEEWDIFFK